MRVLKNRSVSSGVLLLVMIAIAGLTAGSAAAAVPGISVLNAFGTFTPSSLAQRIKLERDAGSRWAREGMLWAQMQPSDGSHYSASNQAYNDSIVEADRAAGMNVAMLLLSVPYWASADPSKHVDPQGVQHWNPEYRPTNFHDYASFAGHEARHLARLGVHAYEIWNEPNGLGAWPSGVDAKSYLSMLKPAYIAIKHADPRATVVMGGLAPAPDSAQNLSPVTFLTRLYVAGGRRYFDDANLHVYPPGDPNDCSRDSHGAPLFASFCYLSSFHRVMVDHRDRAKSVWMTEFGWSSCAPAMSLGPAPCVTEAQQAIYLTGAYRALGRSYRYVRVAFWHTLLDLPAAPDVFEQDLGLAHSDLTPKLAYAAFRSYSRQSIHGPLLHHR